MGYPLTAYGYDEFAALNPKYLTDGVEYYLSKPDGRYNIVGNIAQVVVADGLADGDGIWEVDRRRHLFAFRIRRVDADIVVSVRAILADVRVAFEEDLTDGIERLIEYFQQADVMAPIERVLVGAKDDSSSQYDVAERIVSALRKTPPTLPGSIVWVEQVEPYLEWAIEGNGQLIEIDGDGDDDRSSRTANSTANARIVVPAVVWVSNGGAVPDDGSDIRNALMELLSEYGFVSGARGSEVRGSWRQKLAFWTKDAYKKAEAKGWVAEVEERLRVELLSKAAAEAGNVKADSASKLIQSIEAQSNAFVLFDQILVIKDGGSIIVRSLDPVTAAKIERCTGLCLDHAELVELVRSVLQLDSSSTRREVAEARGMPAIGIGECDPMAVGE